MKQKYTIVKDDKTGALTIQEYAELSKDLFSLICEETYPTETIATAMGESKKELVDTLRTPNLYPISDYIDKIADTVIGLFDSSVQPESDTVELIFDDVDLFKKEDLVEDEDEAVEIEDLLEEDSDDEEDIDDVDDDEDEEDEAE